MNNKSLLIHGGWLVAAAAAFAIGRVSSPTPADNAESSAAASGSGLAGVAPLSALTSASERAEAEAATNGTSNASGSRTARGGNLLARITAINGETDDVRKNLLFAQLLMDVTRENAPEMLAAMQEQGLFGEGRRDFGPNGRMGLFFQAWGKLDGKAAIDAAVAMDDGNGNRRGPPGGFAAMAALSAWGGTDSAAAIAWLDSQTAQAGQEGEEGEEGDRGRIRFMSMALVNGMADANPVAAADYVMKLTEAAQTGEDGNRRDRWINDNLYESVTEAILKTGTEAAMAWANSLPSGDFKEEAINTIAEQYAREDITKAAKWAESIIGQEGSDRAVGEVAERMRRDDPAATVDWLMKLPADAQGNAVGETFREWTDNDELAASEYLAEMPASPAKDSAISNFSRELDREDPASAIVWANTIGDTEIRARTVREVTESWARTDQAAAVAYMQSSGVSAEQQQQILESSQRGRRGRRD